MKPTNPLIAIIGATGTGKSQLAVEIAQKFDGEIINGDAMQLYEGLPIITNKIPVEERQGIPHHLLGCISLREQPWTVGTFATEALKTINEMRSRGKTPVLVGGTHYYTQSLLFKEALTANIESGDLVEKPAEADGRFEILDQPTDVILANLQEVDPVMANRWHPSERRKLQRSLAIWLTTGKPASQVYEEQAASLEALSLTKGTRFPTIVLWVHTDPDALRQRLDKRVDHMVENGLLAEAESMHLVLQAEEAAGHTIDQSRGIWVSIGFKEFKPYLEAVKKGVDEKDIAVLKQEGVERTKSATRQYAKSQLKWIRIKFLNALRKVEASSNTFLLDASDVSQWNTKVRQPAQELVERFLAGSDLPDPASTSETAKELLTPKRDYDLSDRRDKWFRRTCEICNTTVVTEEDWVKHIKGRSHRGVLRKKTRLSLVPVQDQTAEEKKEEEGDALDAIERLYGSG